MGADPRDLRQMREQLQRRIERLTAGGMTSDEHDRLLAEYKAELEAVENALREIEEAKAPDNNRNAC